MWRKGSEIHTDELASYEALPEYIRRHVTHGKGMYVGAGNVHVNSVESMWSVFKRGVYGIWHSVSVKHLRRYVNEATFRLNGGQREDTYAASIGGVHRPWRSSAG